MRKSRGASNTAALSFSPRVPQRWADSVERRWASRSAAEFFSEPTAMARARGECARSPFSALKRPGSEEDVLNRIMGLSQPAAPAAGGSSRMKHPRRQIAVKRKQVDCRFHGPATGSGQFRAVLRSAAARSGETEPATGCRPSLSLVDQIRPLQLEKIDCKSRSCHDPISELRKMWLR